MPTIIPGTAPQTSWPKQHLHLLLGRHGGGIVGIEKTKSSEINQSSGIFVIFNGNQWDLMGLNQRTE